MAENPLAIFNLLDTRIGDRVLNLAALTAMIDGGTEEQQSEFALAVSEALAGDGWSGQFLTGSLNTAADANATVTIPVPGMTADGTAVASYQNGTNTDGLFTILTVTPGDEEIVVVLRNIGAAAANGTIRVSFIIAATPD